MFWISYPDLLRKYQSFDRTRLFGPEWQVTQQWTSLDVPWTADYNDTKFRMTITQAAPVVIVLSQLDSRYFRGLEGQYTFQLHFRLERDGESDYIVRSHGNYSMSRSVSADIDLEPGTYSVLMKITGKRWTGDLTPDQVIRNNCMERPEKLIQVGLSYDLAHAKGQIKETEEEKAARKAYEQKKKAADHQKRRTELREQMLKEWETGKKRLARTKRQSKRKEAYFKRKAEEAKAAEEVKDVKTAGTNEGIPGTEEEATEEQAPQVGSEPEQIEAPEMETNGPLSPPPEGEAAQLESAGAEQAAEPSGQAESSGEVATAPDEGQDGGEGDTAVQDEEQAPNNETGPGNDAEEDENWEYASDASFQSSIVTELDLPPFPDVVPENTPAADDEPDSENAKFEDDPWNAVCVVGLKVYSKDKDLCVEIVRPRHLEGDGDTPLDLDDASKGQSVEKIEESPEKETPS